MKGKKLLAAILAIVMILALLPTISLAAAEPEYFDVSGTGICLGKSAQLEDNGTYTITLQAVSTGEDTVVVTNRPADIVMVLDTSTSMDNAISSTTTYSVVTGNTFSYQNVNSKNYYYKDGDAYYKVSVDREGSRKSGYTYGIYFTKNGTKYYLSGSTTTTTRPTNVTNASTQIWYGDLYSATTTSVKKIDALKDAAKNFVDTVAQQNADNKTDSTVAVVYFNQASGITSASQVVTSENKETIKTRISNLTTAIYTRADLGMNNAKTIINNLLNTEGYDKEGRDRVVIFFTDGVPTGSTGGNTFTESTANSAISTAKSLKDSLKDNGAGAVVYAIGCFGNDFSADEMTKARAYMNRLSNNSLDATTYQNGTVDTKKGCFIEVDSAKALDDIFQQISQTIGGTTVEYGSDAVVKDIISNEFELPEGFSGGNVEVKVYNCTYADGKYVKGTVDSEKTNAAKKTAAVTGKTISVSGFDYKSNFVTAAHPGYGLEIIIRGVTANDKILLQDGAVYTNGAASGLYENAKATETPYTFYMPTAAITRQTVVLDYSKTVSIDVSKDPIYQNEGTTSLYKSFGPVDPEHPLTSIDDGNNGVITLNGKTLTYTLNTMQLSGYDTARLLGKTNEASVLAEASTSQKTLNIWSYVSFVPANNVYYEDTFVSTENGDTVGITYSEGWNMGNASADSIPAGDMGDWITAGEKTDGTEAAAPGALATATFTFNGTGFDIYGKTSGASGIVAVRVYKIGTDGSEERVARKWIDLQSSKDYYDVPAIFWNGTTYGTYRVELTVCKDGSEAPRLDYCIDGIRIYSPLKSMEKAGDDVVEQAYDDMFNMSFLTVRDILIENVSAAVDGDTILNGAVFIDPTQGEDWEETVLDENGNPVPKMVPKQAVDENDELIFDEDGNPVPETDEEGNVVMIQKVDENGYPEYETRKISGSMKNIADYENYGPKNEIYLEPGQSIAIAIDDDYVYIGMRNVDSTTAETKVTCTNGDTNTEYTVKTNVDKYYKMAPNSEGYLFITNNEDNAAVLSITKMMSRASETQLLSLFFDATIDSVNNSYSAFLAAPVAAAQTDAVEAPEEPGITDLTIVNPAAEETADNGVSEWIGDLFGGVRSIFG